MLAMTAKATPKAKGSGDGVISKAAILLSTKMTTIEMAGFTSNSPNAKNLDNPEMTREYFDYAVDNYFAIV
jgi:hypothetical protein